LAELLGLPVPTLPSLQNTLNPSFVTSGAASGGATSAEDLGPQSLWADEEEKKFYEELRELRGEVPASILGVPEEEKPAEDKQEEVVEDKPVEEGVAAEAEEHKDEEPVDEDELEAKKAEE
jgi:regulator of nonsense transcripts 2